MGIIERKERERMEMKRHILNAARKLFLADGFEKTSIRNIADAIEYSPATIYLYYKDKNELFFDLHCEAFDKLIEELQSIVQVSDPYERLKGMGQHYIKYAFENPELYDLMFVMEAPMESLECREEVWDDGKKAFGMLKLVVQESMNAGHFIGMENDNVSLMIWSFMHGLVTLHARKRLSIFPENEREKKMQMAFEAFVFMLKNL